MKYLRNFVLNVKPLTILHRFLTIKQLVNPQDFDDFSKNVNFK